MPNETKTGLIDAKELSQEEEITKLEEEIKSWGQWYSVEGQWGTPRIFRDKNGRIIEWSREKQIELQCLDCFYLEEGKCRLAINNFWLFFITGKHAQTYSDFTVKKLTEEKKTILPTLKQEDPELVKEIIEVVDNYLNSEKKEEFNPIHQKLPLLKAYYILRKQGFSPYILTT